MKTTEKQRKKCVTLAKRIAVLMAHGICEHCGKSKALGWQMHGSHIYSEGVYKSMSADIDNILCLCAACHTGGFWHNSTNPSWHSDPVYFTDWFKGKFPELAETLKLRARGTRQVDWNAKHTELKEHEKSLLVQGKEKGGNKGDEAEGTPKEVQPADHVTVQL